MQEGRQERQSEAARDHDQHVHLRCTVRGDPKSQMLPGGSPAHGGQAAWIQLAQRVALDDARRILQHVRHLRGNTQRRQRDTELWTHHSATLPVNMGGMTPAGNTPQLDYRAVRLVKIAASLAW